MKSGKSLLIGLVVFIVAFMVTQNTDGVEAAPLQQEGNLLSNPSFELGTGNDIQDWSWFGDCYKHIYYQEPANDGSKFLAAGKQNADCDSFYQDVGVNVQSGERYRFAIRARTTNGEHLGFAMAIWNRPGSADEYSQDDGMVWTTGDWTCYETVIQVDRTESTTLRAEVYLKEISDTKYYFDSVELRKDDGNSICNNSRNPDNLLLNPSFEIGSLYEIPYWNWLGEDYHCFKEIYYKEERHDGDQFLATSRNGTADCFSFYQDIPNISVQAGDKYRFAVYARTTNGDPLDFRVDLWNRVTQLTEYSANSSIVKTTGDWSCYEAVLEIDQTETTTMRAEIYLDSFSDTKFYFDDFTFKKSDTPLCPQDDDNLPKNPSFEDYDDKMHPWQALGSCDYWIDSSGNTPYGTNFLRANRRGGSNPDDCTSIYQDIYQTPVIGQKYRYAIWVRSDDSIQRKGRVTLWSRGSQYPEDEESNDTPFVATSEWQCVETELTVTKPGNKVLRVEMYLDSNEAIDYHFDNARFQVGGNAICSTDSPGKERNPLIFIPGIMGSELGLFSTQANGTENKYATIWPDMLMSDIRVGKYIFHKSNTLDCLSTNKCSIRVGDTEETFIVRAYDVVRALPGGSKDAVYGGIIKAFNDAGYLEYEGQEDQFTKGCNIHDKDANLFPFPYDWRWSNTQSAIKLAEYVECINLIHPGKKVDVVAHSMGGLVARSFILDNPDKVDKFISIGSPYLGSPQMIYALESGDLQLGLPAQMIVLGKDEAKELLQNFTGAHELLPSKAYFDFYKDSGDRPLREEGLFDLDNDNIKNDTFSYEGYVKVMNKRYGSLEMTANSVFHTEVQDNWSNDTNLGINTKFYPIVGDTTGKRTTGQVILRKGCNKAPDKLDDSWFDFACFERVKVERKYTRGDGTVPLYSASRDRYKNYNPLEVGEDSILWVNDETYGEHGKMPTYSRVQKYIICLLEGKTTREHCENKSRSKRQTFRFDPMYHINATGLEQVLVTDQQGQKTGEDDDVVWYQIDGVEFLRPADNYLVDLPTNKTFTVQLRTGNPSTSLEVTKSDGTDNGNHMVEAIRYLDLNLPNDTLLEIQFTSNDIQKLKQDTNGDDIVDTVITPTVSVVGELAADTDSPKIDIIVSESLYDQSIVEIFTEDVGIADVEQVYYSTDGRYFKIYTDRFAIDTTEVFTIYAFADDKVGNRSTLFTRNTSKNQSSLTPNFTSPTIGPAPLNISFTDTSTGTINEWLWNFGDGTTSTEQNPTHTYIQPGSYTVTLTITDSMGSETLTRANYITVLEDGLSALTLIKRANLTHTFQLSGTLGQFSLTTDEERTFTNLTSTTHTITIDPTSYPDEYWQLVSVQCYDRSRMAYQIDHDNYSVDISVEPGEHLTCELVSERAGYDDDKSKIYLPLITR